jgi:hypothetical protein
VETGAVKRLRGFSSPEALLRTLLLHVGLGYSLRETVVRARLAGWADVSDVALLKRMRNSEEWLRFLCIALLREGRAFVVEETGRKDNEYVTMNNLGGVLYQTGDFRGARKLFEDLLALRKAAADRNGVAFAKTNLADVLRVQGELDPVVTFYREALATFKELGDRSLAAAVQLSFARALLATNDPPERPGRWPGSGCSGNPAHQRLS